MPSPPESAGPAVASRGRRALLLLLCVVAIGASIAQTLPRQLGADAGADLAADYASARDLFDGKDPYTRELPASMRRHVGPGPERGFPANQPNPHSPALIATTTAVAKVPWVILRVLWLVGSSIAVTASCWLFARRVGFDNVTGVTVGLVALALPVTQDALFNGTVEPFLLLLSVLAWFAAEREDARTAGLLFGGVVALKLYPLLLALAFVRRHRSVFAWTAGAAAVYLLIGCAVTTTNPLDAFGETRTDVEIWGTAALNIGIPAFVFQLFDGPFAPLPDWALVVYAASGAAAVAWIVGGRRDLWGAAPAVLLAPICWNSYLLFTFPALIRQLRARVWPALLGVTTAGIGTSWGIPLYDATANTVGGLTAMVGEAKASDTAVTRPN